MAMNGNKYGGPESVTQGLIYSLTSSPIRVSLTETLTDTVMNGVVTIEVLASVPSGTYKLRVAAVEELITFATPPGSNGEKEFPNVFRKFIANGQVGETVNLQVGQIVTYKYSYTLNSKWKRDQMYTIAWVQNETSKEILNSARAEDKKIEFFGIDFQKGSTNQVSKLKGTLINVGNTDQEMSIKLTSTHPSDWAGNYTYNGTTSTDEKKFLVPAGQTTEVGLNVTPGQTSNLGRYLIEVQITGNDEYQAAQFGLISGVSDLVVARDAGTVDLKLPYTSGLTYALNKKFAILPDELLVTGIANGALNDIKNIFYSIGWVSPAFTMEQVVELKKFLNRGGNLMLSGMDIGWDIFDPDGSSTDPVIQDFYKNYLKTDYVDDGTTTRTRVSAVTTDAIFKATGASTLTRPYGTSNLYPDKVKPNSVEAFPIFTYNNAADIAATRAETSKYKTVYFGIGLEHISNRAVADVIVKTAHDWFYGLISSTEFDQAMAALQMGQNIPNPAQESTIIPFEGVWSKDMTLQVVDLNGRVMLTREVMPGSSQVEVNTASLPAGVYFYQLTDGQSIGAPHKLVVVH